MIELTVGLPMYFCKEVGWLSLEGLIAQKNINFGWELLIAEEQDENMMGEENILSYGSKLEAVGCERITYVPLKEWRPLSHKWMLFRDMISPSSRIFIVQGAEDYPYCHRLKDAYNAFKKNPRLHWFHQGKGIFYNFQTGKLILFDCKDGYRTTSGLGISIRTSVLQFPLLNPRIAQNDAWLYGCVYTVVKKRVNKKWNQSPYLFKGLFTRGMNSLSPRHYLTEEGMKAPWSFYDGNIEDIIPEEIIKKIRQVDISKSPPWLPKQYDKELIPEKYHKMVFKDESRNFHVRF